SSASGFRRSIPEMNRLKKPRNRFEILPAIDPRYPLSSRKPPLLSQTENRPFRFGNPCVAAGRGEPWQTAGRRRAAHASKDTRRRAENHFFVHQRFRAAAE